MSSKAKALITGSILRVTEFFATTIVTLVMTPFIIRSLGDNMYGLWIFVGSFLGYYGLMDFGLNSAIQRYTSRAIGSRDYEEANKVINTALFIFILIGLFVLIVSFFIALFLPLIIKNITEIAIFRIIILILGFNFAIGFPLRVFSGVLVANIRYNLNTAIELTKLILRTVLIIIFLKRGYGIIALALIIFFTDIMGYTMKYLFIRNLYKYIIISKKLFVKTKVKVLFSYSIYSFITQIANEIRFNIDNLVIVTFIGLGPVTLYSIGSRFIKYFRDLVIAAIGIFMPIFSQYESVNDYKAIRKIYLFTINLSVYISIFIGGLLIIFGRTFIKLWVGEKYLGAYPILVTLTIPMIIELMQGSKLALLQGISRHKYYAISNMGEGIVNLILSIIFVKRFGILGVALGTAIPMAINKIFIQPAYICKIINLSLRDFYLKTVGPASVKSLIIIGFIWWFSKNIIQNNYFIIITISLLGSIIYLSFIFLSGLNHFERSYFRKAIFGSNRK